MTNEEKYSLSRFKNNDYLDNILQKLILEDDLNYSEKEFILSVALILAEYYNKDERLKSYFELSYYIVLKYSITYNDYEPLYDFSYNFGFYPISKYIVEMNILNHSSLIDFLSYRKLDRYSYGNIIETSEQSRCRRKILNNEFNELCYIAPTSYGKSSLIMEYLSTNIEKYKKICIIVPSKSLIVQTYKTIRSAKFDRKLLFHEEMYKGEEAFISVFTQERTLRFLEKHNASFDVLFIDEAHKLFSNDSRSIKLARAIRYSLNRNSSTKIIYLSPLISNHSNLKLTKHQDIVQQRIEFNIKEPEIYEYKLNNKVYKYNRFQNKYYEINSDTHYLDYIINKIGKKNFIYNRRPVKIEEFCNRFVRKIDLVNDNELDEIIAVMNENVHPDFYINDYLQYGLIYLHAKIPDLIKEYLEYKFSCCDSIKYVVANSVILEGINLPIDTMFILNTRSLGAKDLTNLIGRANRLNHIFSKGENNLHRLMPQIHFVNNREYNNINSNMSRQIELLRSRDFEDDIMNPVLATFDMNTLNDEKKKKAQDIINNENFVLGMHTQQKDIIKSYLIKEGIDEYYSDLDDAVETIAYAINSSPTLFDNDINVIDKIYLFFIKNNDSLSDFEIGRLRNLKARNYYNNFILVSKKRSLKGNIVGTTNHFITIRESNNPLQYFGDSYGEVTRESYSYGNKYLAEVYINLRTKTDVQLVNLAIVKLSLENDFVNYKLNKFIVMLYDLKLISTDEYNTYIYGTNNEKLIEFIKQGLSINLITRLKDDSQIDNLLLDKNNNITCNFEFMIYYHRQNDLMKYELSRCIVLID